MNSYGSWMVWLPPVPILLFGLCIIFGWWRRLPCFEKKEHVLLPRRREQELQEESSYGTFTRGRDRPPLWNTHEGPPYARKAELEFIRSQMEIDII